MGVSGLILSFFSYRGHQVVPDEKSLLEYPDNTGIPQGSILGTMLFPLYIKSDLPDDIIYNTAIFADSRILYSNFD